MSLSRFYNVDELFVSLIETPPPAFVVIVSHSRVTSSGWSGGV